MPSPSNSSPTPTKAASRRGLPDIPAYGEGDTENEAIEDLKEAIRGYIETFGLDDALSRVAQPALRTIDLDLAELARA